MISICPFSISTCLNRLFFGLFLFFFLPLSPALAQTSPVFKSPEGRKTAQIIDFVKSLNNQADTAYDIASIDLNDDFLNEYIVKPQGTVCPPSKLCYYQIIALQDRQPILIGQFDAHKILISDKKSYGIRNLIVYNVPRNDFKHVNALWNPFSYQFELR